MPASLAASARLMPSRALAIASIRSAARRFGSCRARRRSASGVRSSRIGSAPVRFAVRNRSHRTVDSVSVKVRTVGFGQEPAGTEAPRRFRAPRPKDIPHSYANRGCCAASCVGGRREGIHPSRQRGALHPFLILIDKDVAPVPGMTMMDCPRSVVHQLIGMHDAGDFSIGSSRTQCSITRNDSVELRVVVTGRDVCPPDI